MGLPGSGKTTLAKDLVSILEFYNLKIRYLNADIVREEYNDWDFSVEGRLRQSTRMRKLADLGEDDFVIADFIAPLEEMRYNYNADFTIWVDTIQQGRFSDTNRLFLPPITYDVRVDSQDSKQWAKLIIIQLFNKFGNNKS